MGSRGRRGEQLRGWVGFAKGGGQAFKVTVVRHRVSRFVLVTKWKIMILTPLLRAIFRAGEGSCFLSMVRRVGSKWTREGGGGRGEECPKLVEAVPQQFACSV